MSAPVPHGAARRAGPPIVLPVGTDPRPCGVLLVEDDRLAGLMLRSGLERHRFRVWVARDAAGAIEVYRASAAEIAIVLVDAALPDRRGTLDALHRLNPAVVACLLRGDGDVCAEGTPHRIAGQPLLLDETAERLRALARRAVVGPVDLSGPVGPRIGISSS